MSWGAVIYYAFDFAMWTVKFGLMLALITALLAASYRLLRGFK